MPKQQREKCPASAKVRARAGARARKLQGQKTNHPRCGPKRARRRCGGSAETPPSCMPPMVTPLANVGGLVRRPVSASLLSAPPPCFLPVGVHGRPPARIRLPKLAPAPSNAHEQPYPPTPQKKIRARAKAATKTLAPRPRALPRGPTCMWPFQPRGLPSTRWTLARAHAAAAPALQKPLTKRRKRFRGLRAAPFCAKMPAPATGSLLRLGCHFARFRHTHRSLPFACERFAGSATQPDYCEGCRYGCQVRLSGTALRYGSQVLLRAASAPVILAHTRAPSSPISAHLPSPHRRHSMLIPTPTHAPSTHILSRTRAINFKHLP